METTEKVPNINLEILRVLKEINSKLDAKKQITCEQDERSKTEQLT